MADTHTWMSVFAATLEKRSKMSTQARIIPFPERSREAGNSFSFSFNDERLIRGLLGELRSELAAPIVGYETRARLYFYLGLHRCGISRWLDLLRVEESKYNQHLSEQINEIFQYLTSTSMLEDDAPSDRAYRAKIDALSGNMFSLLQQVRSRSHERRYRSR
jgi:hypothetical protein